MANKEDLALMAHLMRRAGFGASQEELEAYVAKGYEATVEELLNPSEDRPEDKANPFAMVTRYHPGTLLPGGVPTLGQAAWVYSMINSRKPLQEKVALFWHHVFATGNSKVDNCDQMLIQIDMFREYGLGSYKELLVQVAKNPAMIYWLDNNENHRDAVNENWGRELLELFSMGVSNYTEVDVREASRAFTGWTISPKIPRLPYGRFSWHFDYREYDHDDGEKTFLGYTGNFDGDDIIDIIVREPSTARFICRHVYNFFVADEVQVPAWTIEPARDEDALDQMMTVFEESNYDMRALLRFVFNSDFFKNARYSKIKSPAEVVAGTLRMAGSWTRPGPRDPAHRFAVQLHGPGPDGPAQRGRLVHRFRVDQQRLPVGPGQLCGRPSRQPRQPRRTEGHRLHEGVGRHQPGAACRSITGAHGLSGARR